MITKTIAVCQMATVLGRTMTAIRECIAEINSPLRSAGKRKAKRAAPFQLIEKGSGSTWPTR